MVALLPAVLPVGLIILIGFIANKAISLERQTLSQLILYILSPALVIDSLYRTSLSLESSIGLLVGFAITSCLVYLVAKIVSRITGFSSSLKTALIATSLFPNNGNMGLPIVTFALGTAGLERAIVYMIGSSILMFCFGPAIIQGKGIIKGLKLIVKLPLLWAILLGLGLRIISLTIPNFQFPFDLDLGIQKLGEAAIPIALILLGMQLAYTKFTLGLKELLAASIRLLIAPSIAFGVGSFLNLASLDLQVLVLQSAMPTAVNSLILVTEFGGNKNFVARSIITSTLFCFLTIPFILWLLRF
ncbi:putative permease [Hyella patelloides LEGE 07179]|uniref:Putative permease n=1 Tax=Hyella patelloides LEGE 07179 TaxID=945734 RepID=A0A563VMN6_9CYAN|nr:AEC family transporter [Hyella patelloides]VEP12716.1 putative permease [Hyella patelloides LEGE 07179]